MYVVVLVLGILATVLGAATTAYGITLRELSFGNSLLIVGGTAVVGGLVLIGIAGAIRELHRIVNALTGRQMPRYQRSGEAWEPEPPSNFRPGGVPARMPGPPMPPMSQPPSQRTGRDRPAEARVETSEPVEASTKHAEPPAPVFEPVTASSSSPEPVVEPVPTSTEPEQLSLLSSDAPPVAPSVSIAPPPVVDESEAIPLSPHEPDDPRQRLFDRGDVSDQPAMPDSEARAPDTHDDQMTRSEPANERSAFDAIWPPRTRPAVRVADDTATPEEAAPPVQPVDNSVSTSPEPETTPSHTEPPGEKKAPAPHPVSILKSGVVDGMAYTLYSDGSIEAELASGTIHFASIQELRAHLERAG